MQHQLSSWVIHELFEVAQIKVKFEGEVAVTITASFS
jgi:hypothetical protein